MMRLLRRERAAESDFEALDTEEHQLSEREAQLAEQLAELAQREGWLGRELEGRRQSLGSFTSAPASERAAKAIAGLRPFLATHDTLPEREKALEARRQAVAARRAAVEAEKQMIARRQGALAQAQEQLAGLDAALAQIRNAIDEQARAAEQAQRDREARERAAAEQAQRERAAREQAVAAQARAPKAQPRQAAASSSQASERRRVARVKLETSVDLSSDSNLFLGFSSDIAQGGIFVATTRPLAAGTEVDLSFTLPGDNKVEARGVVRWSREPNVLTPDVFPGIGVQFTELSACSRTSIEAFIAEREPLFWE